MYIHTIDYNQDNKKKEKKKRVPISKSKKLGKINIKEPVRQTTSSFDPASKKTVKTNWVDRMDSEGNVKLVPQEH